MNDGLLVGLASVGVAAIILIIITLIFAVVEYFVGIKRDLTSIKNNLRIK